MARFKKGMKVRKTFYGIGGYEETREDVVESVQNGIVYTYECEGGITFDAVTGRERENFFPGIHQEIVPFAEKDKPAKVRQKKPATPKRTKAATTRRSRKNPTTARLTVADVANPMFDQRKPVRRTVKGRQAIEWVTITDEFVKVGCTYYLGDGHLHVVAFDPLNLPLYEHTVFTREQFARAMKTVDRNYKKRTA